jgi:hypothetical protein
MALWDLSKQQMSSMKAAESNFNGKHLLVGNGIMCQVRMLITTDFTSDDMIKGPFGCKLSPKPESPHGCDKSHVIQKNDAVPALFVNVIIALPVHLFLFF